MDFHASVDLDTRLARRWRVCLLLLVVLQSLVEPPLLSRHASLRRAVRGLASAEVGVIGQIHLARVRRVSWTLVAQVLHLHLSSWWRSLVKPTLIWLHLVIVWPSVVLEILRLALVHIHVVRRRSLVHTVVILGRNLVRASSVLLLWRISLSHSVVLRRLVRVLALVVWWLSVVRRLALVHSIVRSWSLVGSWSLVRSWSLVWPWPLIRPSVHR